MIRLLGTPSPTKLSSSYMIAVSGHILFFAFLLLIPKLGWFPENEELPEVRLVRLKGGGENIPGWINPTTAPSDDAMVPDGVPKKTTPPKAKEEPKAQPSKPKEEIVKPAIDKKPVENVTKTEPQAVESSVTEETSTSSTEETPATLPVETSGEGIGQKPGPEGPGFGAKSDAEFAGADAYLSRIEAEVQRRFNFEGNGTGAIAEYHFFIYKNGKLKEMLLNKSSGIARLDLAARSALMRSKFPPLPASFRHEKLGVTWRFYDAD
jgi:outer membrane biosynthesis protein TonB